jgi:integrase
MRKKFIEKRRWCHRLARSRYPGVFVMEEGGCIVRARVRDRWKQKVEGVKWSGYTEIKRVFKDKTEAQASAWLEEERQRISSRTSATKQERLFAKFALSVLEEKARLHELSMDKQADWKQHLTHLIEGTTSKKDSRLSVTGFGNLMVDEITYDVVTQWKVGISRLIFETREYKPGYTNGWYSTLKTILGKAKTKFALDKNAMEGISRFTTSKHSTYSFERPNSLTVEQLPEFLRVIRKRFPQHYALAKFGFATGIRLLNLSPLRRRPDETGDSDINWESGLCYIRRGYTKMKDMNPTTKNREVYPITIPPSLLADLEWHCRTQLPKGQENSIFLFPSEKGEPRQGSILTKPFIEASQAIGLKSPLTIRGMRRTFNRLMLKAEIDAMITRSITGHKTAAMQEHYTDKDAEQHRNAIESAMAMLEGRWSKAKAA